MESATRQIYPAKTMPPQAVYGKMIAEPVRQIARQGREALMR